MKTKKKTKTGLHQKWKPFFPRIQVETCNQMHTRVKLLEGMQMKTLLKLLGGGYSQIIGGNISPPGFGTPESNYADQTQCLCSAAVRSVTTPIDLPNKMQDKENDTF